MEVRVWWYEGPRLIIFCSIVHCLYCGRVIDDEFSNKVQGGTGSSPKTKTRNDSQCRRNTSSCAAGRDQTYFWKLPFSHQLQVFFRCYLIDYQNCLYWLFFSSSGLVIREKSAQDWKATTYFSPIRSAFETYRTWNSFALISKRTSSNQ